MERARLYCSSKGESNSDDKVADHSFAENPRSTQRAGRFLHHAIHGGMTFLYFFFSKVNTQLTSSLAGSAPSSNLENRAPDHQPHTNPDQHGQSHGNCGGIDLQANSCPNGPSRGQSSQNTQENPNSIFFLHAFLTGWSAVAANSCRILRNGNLFSYCLSRYSASNSGNLAKKGP